MARGFNGSSDVISVGLGVLTSAPNGFTFAAQAFSTNWTATGAQMTFMSEGIFSTGTFLYLGASSSGVFECMADGASFFGSGFTATNNQWYDVVMTLATSNIMSIYVNGVFRTSTSITPTDVTALNYFTIGRAINANRFMSGSVAEGAVWNVALTAGEIAAMYQGERRYRIRRASLIGYWPLDGLQSPEPDLSGFRQNGTPSGTTKTNGPPLTLFSPLRQQIMPASSGGIAPVCTLPLLGSGPC